MALLVFHCNVLVGLSNKLVEEGDVDNASVIGRIFIHPI
jgi:hypothetical protein